MKLSRLNETLDTGAVADRVGVFALQAENPGLLPSLKSHQRKKRAKVNYSPFSNDADARKQHITGELDNNGQKKKGVKIGESKEKSSFIENCINIDKKLLRLMLEHFTSVRDPYFDQIIGKFHSSISGNEVSSATIYNAVKPLLDVQHCDESILSYAGHVKDILTGFGVQSLTKQSYIDKDDFNYIYDYAKRRSTMSDQDTNKYLNRDQLQIKLDLPQGASNGR